MIDMSALPLWASIAIFVVAAIVIWVAGTLLARYVDAISDKTGMGQAFAGMLLLGGVTSSPEVGVVLTSAAYGDAALASNNLLGSLAINVVLLAMGDIVARRRALTSFVANPSSLMFAALGILDLTVVAIAILVGDVLVLGVGLWTVAIAGLSVFAFWLAAQYGERAPWRIDRSRDRPAERQSGGRGEGTRHEQVSRLEQRSLAHLVAVTTAIAAAIFVGGYALSRTADAIASATGLGSGLFGLVLVGFATSLPEVSTILAAIKLKRYEMAIGDVFGTNIFNLAIFFVGDAVYAGGPILNEAGRFEAVAALIGVVLTGIYLVGLLERDDRRIFGMGYDSAAVIVVYAGGLGLLISLQ